MAKRTESYTDTEGYLHFADADAGDNVYYDLDLEPEIIAPTATLDSVSWTLPDGITSDDSYETSYVSFIKLNSPTAGTYTLKCSFTSSFGGKSETNVASIRLTVF